VKNVLVISAHADDESFGMGGVLTRLARQPEVSLNWLIMTSIWEPKWNVAAITSREKAIQSVTRLAGFQRVTQWEYQDNKLETYPINDLQERLIAVLEDCRPDTIFTPSIWDFNHEHRLACELVEMSSKPYYTKYVDEVVAYEIPSSSDAAFSTLRQFPANLYFDIEGCVEGKLELVRHYDTELHRFPHPRSSEYLESLSRVRGGESGFEYAEAFHVLRSRRR
jgi:LmbE family N-acetylglucosaminyl deacetylase